MPKVSHHRERKKFHNKASYWTNKKFCIRSIFLKSLFLKWWFQELVLRIQILSNGIQPKRPALGSCLSLKTRCLRANTLSRLAPKRLERSKLNLIDIYLSTSQLMTKILIQFAGWPKTHDSWSVEDIKSPIGTYIIFWE